MFRCIVLLRFSIGNRTQPNQQKKGTVPGAADARRRKRKAMANKESENTYRSERKERLAKNAKKANKKKIN